MLRKGNHMNKYFYGGAIHRISTGAGISFLSICSVTALASNADREDVEADKVKFTNIALNDANGINFRRTKSASDDLWDDLRSRGSISVMDFATSAPVLSRGSPGVALFDYDGDSDLDIYVTNGPGSPNSLYASQLADSGIVKFVDVADSAGVSATEMDSSGVCFGDTDNDGDQDLYVVGAGYANRLFVNNSDGTFSDVSSDSDVGGKVSFSVGCSMGDTNGDGLLDIVVANTTLSWDSPLAATDHNELLLNLGDNLFEDFSQESGITRLAGFAPEQEGAPGLTWAVAMVDYDLDSDVDIVTIDDHSNYPVGSAGGVPGLIHLFQNDGTGKFMDVTVEKGLNLPGAWMGASFGDINADGNLDMFVTNMGDYVMSQYFPYQIGDMASRWFLGRADATFEAQEVKPEDASALGWGTVMVDYDNDTDTDIIYHGGFNGGPLIDASNPGIVLENDGDGRFLFDRDALSDTNHSRRSVHGLASGDINNDGFIDLVSVSNFNIPESEPLIPYSKRWGSSLDDTAFFVESFTPIGPMEFTWGGMEFENGTLSVDINSADNGKGSVSVGLMGTAGVLKSGRSNRDGIGATVRFTPKGGRTAMRPVIGGDSYASQNSLTSHFGLGGAETGTVDILWPGGTKNRLYNVKSGESIIFPEIPCSYDSDWRNINEYKRCINGAIKTLVDDGRIDRHIGLRLFHSSIRAYSSSNSKRRFEGYLNETPK